MEKKKVTVEGSISAGAFIMFPISETTCSGEQTGGTVLFRAAKVPVAVVVISTTGRKVFRITGEEISFEALTRELPGVGREISDHMVETDG